jgi:pantoate--beta-alanine ligase
MVVVRSVRELREHITSLRAAGRRIGFVPTMGNLHHGHVALMREAHTALGPASAVVVSIFVNRLQFGPHEDFDRYPRTLSDDLALCREAGVSVVFAPDETVMYPVPQGYVVEPPAIQHVLDGAVRPGHFRGVATVVLKLLNMVTPDVAVFGRKDYQQCRVLVGMVEQLDLPVTMLIAPTVRAPDGLALSSRNSYLSVAERAEAPMLYGVLKDVCAGIALGSPIADAEAAAVAVLRTRGWQPDYVSVRRQNDLAAPLATDHDLVVLGAAKLGATRLIDNIEFSRP